MVISGLIFLLVVCLLALTLFLCTEGSEDERTMDVQLPSGTVTGHGRARSSTGALQWTTGPPGTLMSALQIRKAAVCSGPWRQTVDACELPYPYLPTTDSIT